MTDEPVIDPEPEEDAPAEPPPTEEVLLVEALRRKEWLPSHGQVLLVSIRGESPLGTNSFDDRAGTVYRDREGNLEVKLYDATNDPGTYWLENPSRPGGCAVPRAGYYTGSMQLGDHRGKPGLVNWGLVAIGYDRYITDGSGGWKVNLADQKDYIGLNIHRAGKASTHVNKYSAGCTVFAKEEDLEAVLKTCELGLAFSIGSRAAASIFFSYAILEYSEVHGMGAS